MPSKIKKAEGSYDPSRVEKKISEYWANEDVYAKLKSMRSRGRRIYFLDGPPYTTGDVHLGTALNKFLKDARIRYWRMKGYNVRDQPGWDMHGLPIEVNVEKSFGLKSKKDIQSAGVEKFVQECMHFAVDNLNRMTEQFTRLGVWMDWHAPYMTIRPGFTEAAWDMLAAARDKGLLYEGLRSIQWCSRCGTALAEAEIEYVDRRDPSIYLRLKTDRGSLLVWTTTPWTIPANMAVAVHPQKDYALVRYSKEGAGEELIVLQEKAEDIGAIGGYEEYEELEIYKGTQLEGLHYEYPLEGFAQKGKRSDWSWKVILSETVETEYTGLVHTAPGHGPEDFELGVKYGLDIYSPVDEEGRFTEAAGQALAGKKVEQASELILHELESRGLLYYSGTVEHRYGTCWRCHTPIIYRATNQWYIRATSIRERMIEEISRVKWYPDWAGSARQLEWARNLKDWCISRQRFWGTPIPVWKCRCGEQKQIASIKELATGNGYVEGMDLHRPHIDAITFTCSKCGGEMHRVPDVLDVWIDSGICSWASLNYPMETEEFEQWWPAKWIVEAGDQTRGWFNAQLVTSIIKFDKAPFESAMLHGWVNDAKGRQMHKSLGNAISPMEIVEKDGVDSLRFYMLSSRAPWEDLSFQPDGPRIARRTLNILWNVFNFASTYMELDDFRPSDARWKSRLPQLRVEERWLLSVTQRLIQTCTVSMESLEMHKYCRALERFIVEDLSHWYVRLVRGKTWVEEENEEKSNAYTVLHYVLTELSKLLATVTPFIAEEIFLSLNPDGVSVHTAAWPEPQELLVNGKLEEQMALAREIAEMSFKARQDAGVKLRWPLPRIVIKPKDDASRQMIASMLDIIEKQVNVKSSKLLSPSQEWEELVLKVMPNPNAIGKVYRQWAGKISMILSTRPAAEIIEGIRKGSYTLGIEGQTVKIEENMVQFTYSLPRNVKQMEFSAGTLYIDFNMDAELLQEALAREVIRRIQKLRKDMNLQVDEFALCEIAATGSILEAVTNWKNSIISECRLKRLEIVEEAAGEKSETWDMDGDRLQIALSRENAPPLQEEQEEAAEQSLESGGTYAVFEEKPERAFAILAEAIGQGIESLCISREYPDRLEKHYGLKGVRSIWLSTAGDAESIRPNDLEKISLQVSDFFKKSSGIVLIDGLEYLISNNSFQPVVKLMQHLRDVAAKSGGILLFSLNPSVLQPGELGLVTKEVDAVLS